MRGWQFTIWVILAIHLESRQSLANDADKFAFFEKRIRPILVEKCYECHSAKTGEPEGGLLLDSREGIRKGGNTGPAVVPGDSGKSLILSALRHESIEMPPDEELPDSVVDDFVTWVEAGAVDPRESKEVESAHSGALDVVAARSRWPYSPPTKPLPPSISNRTWPNGMTDVYLLAELERKDLAPTSDADKPILLRRVVLDLVGIPPSLHEIEAFLNDGSPDSLERLVDRCLASPRFGERWGRHWLDIARYAESSGGGRAVLFPNAWRFRDYVIDAFNRDLPYDQFIREQIAGDLLPTGDWREDARRMTGLGFLALGPKNLDTQDKELLRMDVVDEQIDVIGQAMLGMTLGCARCHDHKFDPIPTRDYYALAGILRSTKTLLPGNVSGIVERELPIEPARAEALQSIRQERSQLDSELQETRKQQSEFRKAVLTSGVVVDDAQAQVTGRWTPSTSVPHFIGKNYLHNEAKGSDDTVVVFSAKLPESGEYEIRLAYAAGTNRAKRVPIAIRHSGGDSIVHVDQTRPPSILSMLEPLGRFRFDDQAVVTVLTMGVKGHVIADAIQLVPVAATTNELDLAAFEKQSDRIKRIESRRKRLHHSAPPPAPVVNAVLEEDQTSDCPLMIRGNVHSLGDRVPRGFLSVVSMETPSIADDASGRLELAEWLSSKDNPLTARVMVNRVWHHLFGRGIVRTTDNFGTRGDPPTHPKLLDALAVRFMEEGWSTKRLLRELVASRAYQLSRTCSPDLSATDLENHLLGRFNHSRFEVEVIRDAMLDAAGSLDLSYGGPGLRTGTTSELEYKFDGRRRTLYVPVLRAALFDMFEVFDFADPNIVVGARTRTILPTQALFFMNSPFAIEQARAAAERLLVEPGLDDDERLDRVFLETLGRPPKDVERAAALEHITNSTSTDSQVDRWAGVFQAIFATIDFRYKG